MSQRAGKLLFLMPLFASVLLCFTACEQKKAVSSRSFEIDGHQVIINGTKLTPGGSSDELVDLLGLPDYNWSPSAPNVVFWHSLGLEANIFDGCVSGLIVRISPRKPEDILPSDRKDYSGMRLLPAFPGDIILDGVKLTPELKFGKLQANKRPPLFEPEILAFFSSGVDPHRSFKVKGEESYFVSIERDTSTGILEVMTYGIDLKKKCNAKPLMTKEALAER